MLLGLETPYCSEISKVLNCFTFANIVVSGAVEHEGLEKQKVAYMNGFDVKVKATISNLQVFREKNATIPTGVSA